MGRGRDCDPTKVVTVSDERIKHLEFIQATIARQASHSFAVKGWSLTVSAAIYAYAASHLTWWLALVALLPPIAFAWLDAFYLRQERMFRELYSAACSNDTSLPLFEMDTRKYCDRTAYPRCSYRSVFKSDTWRVLHAMIFSVGLCLLGIAVFQALGTTEFANCIRGIF